MRKSQISGDTLLRDPKTRDQFISYIKKTVTQNRKKRRQLSNHVGSRWYRAPELILLQKQYDYAQDMWALGCVFFEVLLAAQRNRNSLGSSPRSPNPVLFRGNTCYPLSKDPYLERESGKKNNKIDEDDQMNVILSQLPAISELDKCFLEADEQGSNYLRARIE